MTSLPQEKSSNEKISPESLSNQERLPVVPIREVVLFPLMVLPIAVGREKSVKALEASSSKHNRRLFLVTQKAAQVEDPALTDLYSVGTIGEIVQVFKLPDGSVKTFVQGAERARMVRLFSGEGYLEADVTPLENVMKASPMETEALVRQLRQAFSQYAQLNPIVPQDVAGLVAGITNPDRLADVLAANVALKIAEKQDILTLTDTALRLEKLYALLVREIDILNLEKKIQSRVRGQIEKSQKEYILNEQMKAIQKELRQRDDHSKELEDLRSQVKKADMTKEALEAATKELTRLEKMAPYSPEATVARTYLDWLINMPWAALSKDKIDLKRTTQILDEDHYGLGKAKERILEYLSVCLLKKSLRGPILCFVGPPGVGKTSLARSIARALGRQFARVSMGGVRDESEIRGHRRTYIGALPGRLIQQLRKSKTRNPVFLLDEIDKMGTDWRGDPAAALLEVLDPEQNQNFVDHYLDVGFDLSSVFFVTTANTTYTIPSTLLDRMEVIRFSDYTLREKQEICKRYLAPKQLKEHGLTDRLELSISDEALAFIIEKYTREAGVRNLDREIAKLARKIAREIAENYKSAAKRRNAPEKAAQRSLKKMDEIQKYLGVPKFTRLESVDNGVGLVTGLAWTEYGGEILTIEVAQVPGRGELILTGKLGATMQESAQAAFTYVRSRSDRLAFETQGLKNHDFHLHVPEGAVPKDGPSAGVAMAVSLASFLTNRPVKPGCAMTGEITLLGRVLGVGGIREKLIAAHRHGVKLVLIPKDNEKDLEDVPTEVREGLSVIAVSHMDQVLQAVFS
ncbi:MAG: endopeptidase La [Elusimicrobia bacterium]|nr:endopeptidase La [Elusimicrobiota bacterium]